jgi:hypothetical protein
LGVGVNLGEFTAVDLCGKLITTRLERVSPGEVVLAALQQVDVLVEAFEVAFDPGLLRCEELDLVGPV